MAAAIIVALLLFVPVDRAAAGPSKTFDVTVENGRLVGATDTLKVRQGDAVEIRFASDRPMTLHLHGYDLEARVPKGSPVTMSFVAKLPGRFPISEHGRDAGHHRAVLYIEIHP